jgi:hypothetical protein
VVVREDTHRVPRTEFVTDLLEIPVGPVVHDLVGHREAQHRREHRPRVADRDAVPEQLARLRQRGGEVDRAEDDETRGRRERFDEHRHDFLTRFAVRAVMAGRGESRFELAERVTRDHAVEVGIAQRAHHRCVRPHEQLRAEVRPVDDGRERDRIARTKRRPQRVEDRRRGHQSSGSTKR